MLTLPPVLDAELTTDLPALEAINPEWDELAVACALPLMSPAWVLGWWRHVAPRTTEARVVAVRERGRLVGLAPFFVDPSIRRGRIDYRLPGIDLSARIAPLAAPGREWEVAQAAGAVLERAAPRPDVIALEGAPLSSVWGEALRDGWPGRIAPILRRYNVHTSPIVALDTGDYQEWIARKSSRTRYQLRKVRRRFEEAGGTVRISTRETVRADIGTLLTLHEKRWQERGGGSNLVASEGIDKLLSDAAEALVDQGRFRLFVLEIGTELVSTYVSIAAGGEVLALNGGWDSRWSKLSPTTVCDLYQIEDAIARGDNRFDLGLGGQLFKLLLADGSDPVAWSVLLPARPRRPLTHLRVLPSLWRPAVRDASKRVLSEEQVDRMRELRGRLRTR